ncbi:MAG: histidine kinase [Rhodanobacteraceae bacterium]|nr:histidine kinase [Rhodanobacteraceae bacterium]
MTQAVSARGPLPPLWLPFAAAIPLALCLLLLTLPVLGHGAATVARTLYVFTFVVWVVPLTALQRWLYRRGMSTIATAVVLLVATLGMTLAARALNLAVQVVFYGAPSPEWLSLFRGIEGAWLTLVAYCATHAVVIYAFALQREQVFHSQTRALARDAELAALRYQLQPHFLFNTLNAVSSLVAENRGGEAREMLARLADFLRSTLEQGDVQEVSVAEELAVTETYLEIEQARFGERLRVKWQIGAGVLGARVPYLLLQPLIENAVRHGIAVRRGNGRIEVKVWADQDRLRVHLCNDLPTPGDVSAAGDTRRTGLGLDNVRKRLAHLHPAAHELQAGVERDGRFHVRLSLPLCLPEART